VSTWLVFVLEPAGLDATADELVLEKLSSLKCREFLAINKVDKKNLKSGNPAAAFDMLSQARFRRNDSPSRRCARHCNLLRFE